MNNLEIPKKFKVSLIEEFGKAPVLKEIDTPQLQEGQVLIKVEAAPVNPSDLLFIQGTYPAGKKAPCVPGLEGSGIVVEVTKQIPEWVTVGSRVAFTSGPTSGTHGQYCVSYGQQLIKLDDDVTFEQGASSFVNPVTVIMMLEETKAKGAKTVVQSAAASALGRMMVRYFRDNGIETINIVRRKEQADLLKAEGANFILNQTDGDFKEQLNKLSHQHNATVFFDAIGGEFTSTVLGELPNGSTAYVYGLLSGQPVQVSGLDLIFKNKSVRGFWLSEQLKHNNVFADFAFHGKLNTLLKTSLKTEYQKEFTLEHYAEGLKFYQANQSLGKILIKPN